MLCLQQAIARVTYAYGPQTFQRAESDRKTLMKALAAHSVIRRVALRMLSIFRAKKHAKMVATLMMCLNHLDMPAGVIVMHSGLVPLGKGCV
jgi:hypothetical protein